MFFDGCGRGRRAGGGCEVDWTKRIVIDSITQTIPMNPLGRESCSAEASTIPGFPLHCAKSESTGLLFYVAPILLCWLCPSGCSIIKRAGISAVGSGRCVLGESMDAVKS